MRQNTEKIVITFRPLNAILNNIKIISLHTLLISGNRNEDFVFSLDFGIRSF